jgi:predicted methyltransferase
MRTQLSTSLLAAVAAAVATTMTSGCSTTSGASAARAPAPASLSGAIPAAIATAVADPARPQAERDRDAVRHPAEVLAFAGVKPGDKVGELLPGRGYFTHVFCRIVGASGHVYTLGFPPPSDRPPPPDMGTPGQGNATPGCDNITAIVAPVAEATLPGGLDLVWTSENYHDLNGSRIPPGALEAFNKRIYAALRPGGIYMVEDHAANAGTTLAQSEPLHRIDPAIVRQQLEAAGFQYVGESSVLRNPADTRDAPPFSLQGKSDKFLLKFRKPAH